MRRGIGRIVRELCQRHGVELIEGHALSDHVHILLGIPPKFSVANTVGFLKGKSAIRIHREYLGRQRNFTGYHFWARGYCVSTVGLAEEVIRDYIRKQEAEEKKQEKLELGYRRPLRGAFIIPPPQGAVADCQSSISFQGPQRWFPACLELPL